MYQNTMQSTPGGGCNDISQLTANMGIVNINTSNTTMIGSSSQTVLTAGSTSGTMVKSITIKATGPVTTGIQHIAQ